MININKKTKAELLEIIDELQGSLADIGESMAEIRLLQGYFKHTVSLDIDRELDRIDEYMNLFDYPYDTLPEDVRSYCPSLYELNNISRTK
jgi:hypothetical protein